MDLAVDRLLVREEPRSDRGGGIGISYNMLDYIPILG